MDVEQLTPFMLGCAQRCCWKHRVPWSQGCWGWLCPSLQVGKSPSAQCTASYVKSVVTRPLQRAEAVGYWLAKMAQAAFRKRHRSEAPEMASTEGWYH